MFFLEGKIEKTKHTPKSVVFWEIKHGYKQRQVLFKVKHGQNKENYVMKVKSALWAIVQLSLKSLQLVGPAVTFLPCWISDITSPTG